MTIVLPILGVAFAAFCVWLTVRVVNRRERWAKRTAILLGVATAYGLSFGPACWLTSRLGRGASLLPTIYWPLVTTMRIGEESKERRICAAYSWKIDRLERVPVTSEGRLARFARLGAPAGWHWRYFAIYTFRNVATGDGIVRVSDEAWEWTDQP